MSSGPYVPTMEVVRHAVAFPRERLGEPRPIKGEAFDRFIARVRADALREAANLVEVQITGYVHGGDFEDGVRSGHRNSVHRIRDEADRIEREARDEL